MPCQLLSGPKAAGAWMKSTSKTGERLWNGTPKGTNRSEKCRFRAPGELRGALGDTSGQRSRAWPRTGVLGEGVGTFGRDVLGCSGHARGDAVLRALSVGAGGARVLCWYCLLPACACAQCGG